jgi:NRAMP (natural resistance-associated macrophage protein)-like metal ion transporter
MSFLTNFLFRSSRSTADADENEAVFLQEPLDNSKPASASPRTSPRTSPRALDTESTSLEIDIIPKRYDDDDGASITRSSALQARPWEPTGDRWKDFFYFCGPGWLVSIAYVDPGNYQADIQAGATSRYYLLFAVFWTSVLSLYVQILCVRLAYYGQVTLAEAQARDTPSDKLRYLNWFLAELSIVITDLPEVIGIGIACHFFFGWPYYVGVVLSLVTTLVFLSTMHLGVQVLERIIFCFVAIMSIALWTEMAFVKPNVPELFKGWMYGFVDFQSQDIFSIAGILGAVVMPHNLYLHTAAVQSRRVRREESVVRQAVRYCSIEPSFPILMSFFVNMAVIAVAAESVYGSANAEQVGLTDFCDFFQSIPGGCLLWGVALLAAGQSSAITTTFTGQYVMDGFLNLQLPVRQRAILTRLVAMFPCVIVSILFPSKLNEMVNIVNASLSFLLPFALTPLIKYNCSKAFLGKFASQGFEKYLLHALAISVWAINAITLSVKGGGFFGDAVHPLPWSFKKILLIGLEIAIQIFYALWNWNCLFTPVQCVPRLLEEERPHEDQFAQALTLQRECSDAEIS